MTNDQPSAVCLACGIKYGKRIHQTRAVGVWQAICGVCGKDAACVAARDYGYLRDDWIEEKYK